MSKRSIAILAVLAAVVSAVALYVREHHVGVPVARPTTPPSPVTKSPVPEKTETGPTREKSGISSNVKEQYSAKEYTFLRQHYPPVARVAYGALPTSALKIKAKYIRININRPDRKLLPVINDVLYGKVAALEDKLDTGLSPNATFFMRFPENVNKSLLDVAISAGQRSAIKELLEHGASVNPLTVPASPGTNSEVEVPLQIAAQYGEDDVIRMLLRRGASVNQIMSGAPTGTTLLTPLADAADAGNVSTVYLLLTHGADINSALDPGGTVPSFFLLPESSRGMVAIRKLLIQYGARMPPGH